MCPIEPLTATLTPRGDRPKVDEIEAFAEIRGVDFSPEMLRFRNLLPSRSQHAGRGQEGFHLKIKKVSGSKPECV
jgi:hypothetical protein